MVKKGNKVVCQVLVQWSGMNASHTTQEFLCERNTYFLHFTFEDMGAFHWGIDTMLQIVRNVKNSYY